MLTNLNNNVSTRFPFSAKFQEVKIQSLNRDNVKSIKNNSLASDSLEISPEAKAFSYEENIESNAENNINSKSSVRNDQTDDSATTEARRKLTALKIAQRIAKGDNVPMQDHRFLAEYDSALYKVSLKASLTAKNDDPETHESLADELLELENKLRNPGDEEVLYEHKNDEAPEVEDGVE